MNNTESKWFDYEKVLTETDILEIAKKIGETRKKIDEIEEARKTLRNLQQEKLTLERQLEQGKFTGHFHGIHSYHDPEEGLVTISPDPEVDWRPNFFTSFTREMTQDEKEKYCQIELEFEEPEEENETREESIDDAAATILDQIDYEYYDPGTFVPDNEENEELQKEEETILTNQIPVYKSLKDGSYFLRDNEGKRLPLEVLIEADTTITFMDPFDNDQFLIKRHEDIRLRDQEDTTEPFKEPIYKTESNQYFYIDNKLTRVSLKVLNSLEEVIFLEEDGKEGVIVRKHSEIINSKYD